MSMSDPIADLLTRIRNGIMARHNQVELPGSTLKAAVAEVLKAEGYITGYEVIEQKPQNRLRIELKYRGASSAIDGIQRVSRPSQRIYVGYDNIPKVLSGLGINILSTPQGVMSDRNARSKKVGGEILCSVW